jgi:hypothetical protein
MPSAFDRFMPSTRLQLPNGSVLTIGTLSCDDQIHQAVYLAYTPVGSNAPAMELEFPPKSVEAIIRQLQDYANQARFVNGERMLEYPEPYPEAPRGVPRRRRARRGKKKTGRQGAPPNGGPATEHGNSGVPDGPSSVS